MVVALVWQPTVAVFTEVVKEVIAMSLFGLSVLETGRGGRRRGALLQTPMHRCCG
jgi:hypothetical protein